MNNHKCHCGKNKLKNQIVCTDCDIFNLSYQEEMEQEKDKK